MQTRARRKFYERYNNKEKFSHCKTGNLADVTFTTRMLYLMEESTLDDSSSCYTPGPCLGDQTCYRDIKEHNCCDLIPFLPRTQTDQFPFFMGPEAKNNAHEMFSNGTGKRLVLKWLYARLGIDKDHEDIPYFDLDYAVSLFGFFVHDDCEEWNCVRLNKITLKRSGRLEPERCEGKLRDDRNNEIVCNSFICKDCVIKCDKCDISSSIATCRGCIKRHTFIYHTEKKTSNFL